MPLIYIFPTKAECEQNLREAYLHAQEATLKFNDANEELQAALGHLSYTVGFVKALDALRMKRK